MIVTFLTIWAIIVEVVESQPLINYRDYVPFYQTEAGRERLEYSAGDRFEYNIRTLDSNATGGTFIFLPSENATALLYPTHISIFRFTENSQELIETTFDANTSYNRLERLAGSPGRLALRTLSCLYLIDEYPGRSNHRKLSGRCTDVVRFLILKVGSLVFDILPFNNRPLRHNRLTIAMLGATILKGYSMTVNQVRVVFNHTTQYFDRWEDWRFPVSPAASTEHEGGEDEYFMGLVALENCTYHNSTSVRCILVKKANYTKLNHEELLLRITYSRLTLCDPSIPSVDRHIERDKAKDSVNEEILIGSLEPNSTIHWRLSVKNENVTHLESWGDFSTVMKQHQVVPDEVMNVRMYIPSGHALQGPLVDRGGVFIGWIDYSGPCKPLWYDIEVTELDNNNLTYIVSVKRQLQPYDNIRRYKLNFIIPGRHYSVRVRARVSLLNGTWSQPHSQLDRNYKDFVTRNVLTYMEPYLVGLSLDNEIISSFVGANVWNNVHHTTVQPQSDWYLNSPVLTGADEGYDYFRSFSIKFIKYERQRLRYKEYSTISVTAHTSKDYDRQWVNLAAVIVYGDRFISQNQTDVALGATTRLSSSLESPAHFPWTLSTFMNLSRDFLRTACEQDQYIWIDFQQYVLITEFTLIFPNITTVDLQTQYHTCGQYDKVLNASEYTNFIAPVEFSIMTSMQQRKAPDPLSHYWYLVTRIDLITLMNLNTKRWDSNTIRPLNIHAISFGLFDSGPFGVLIERIIIIGNPISPRLPYNDSPYRQLPTLFRSPPVELCYNTTNSSLLVQDGTEARYALDLMRATSAVVSLDRALNLTQSMTCLESAAHVNLSYPNVNQSFLIESASRLDSLHTPRPVDIGVTTRLSDDLYINSQAHVRYYQGNITQQNLSTSPPHLCDWSNSKLSTLVSTNWTYTSECLPLAYFDHRDDSVSGSTTLMRFIGENQKDRLDTRDGHLYAIQYGIDENGFGDVWFLENITYRAWAKIPSLNVTAVNNSLRWPAFDRKAVDVFELLCSFQCNHLSGNTSLTPPVQEAVDENGTVVYNVIFIDHSVLIRGVMYENITVKACNSKDPPKCVSSTVENIKWNLDIGANNTVCVACDCLYIHDIWISDADVVSHIVSSTQGSWRLPRWSDIVWMNQIFLSIPRLQRAILQLDDGTLTTRNFVPGNDPLSSPRLLLVSENSDTPYTWTQWQTTYTVDNYCERTRTRKCQDITGGCVRPKCLEGSTIQAGIWLQRDDSVESFKEPCCVHFADTLSERELKILSEFASIDWKADESRTIFFPSDYDWIPIECRNGALTSTLAPSTYLVCTNTSTSSRQVSWSVVMDTQSEYHLSTRSCNNFECLVSICSARPACPLELGRRTYFVGRVQTNWSSVYYANETDMFTGDTALVKCEKKFKFPSNITHSNGSHALIQCGMHTRRTWLPDFRTRLPDCEYAGELHWVRLPSNGFCYTHPYKRLNVDNAIRYCRNEVKAQCCTRKRVSMEFPGTLVRARELVSLLRQNSSDYDDLYGPMWQKYISQYSAYAYANNRYWWANSTSNEERLQILTPYLSYLIRQKTSCYFTCKANIYRQYGDWSDWTSWSDCSHVNNTRNRTRKCESSTPCWTGVCRAAPDYQVKACCHDPGNVTHAMRYLEGTDVGSQVRYTCMKGYTLHGDDRQVILSCESTGHWSAPLPACHIEKCVDIDGDHLTKIWSLALHYPGPKQFLYKDQALFSCGEGYHIRSYFPPIASIEIECVSGGLWSSRPPIRCTARPCPSANPQPASGLAVQRFNHTTGRHGPYVTYPADSQMIRYGLSVYYKDIIFYVCDSEHEAVGTAGRNVSYTCMSNMQYDRKIQQSLCVVKTCKEFPTLQNGFVYKGRLPVNLYDAIRVDCHIGYHLQGQVTVTRQYTNCQTDYSYKPSLQPCQPIDCGSPGNGSGADQIQVHAFHYPEKVDYHCQYGYHDNTTREVAVSLTCQSNGTWTRAPPVCIEINCGFPGEGVNAIRDGGNKTKYLDTVYYTCVELYSFSGTSFGLRSGGAVCREDGYWDGYVDARCSVISAFQELQVSVTGINSVTVSFVQTQQFDKTEILYLLDFSGVNRRFNETNNVSRTTTHDRQGQKTVFVYNIQPGYIYELVLRWVNSNITSGRQTDGVQNFTMKTGSPPLVSGAQSYHALPRTFVDNSILPVPLVKQERDSGIDVKVTNLFTEDYGKIRGYTLIVCELNPWLDNSYYHSKLGRKLFTYSMADDYDTGNARYVWPPYQVFKPCDIFGDTSECGDIKIKPYIVPDTTTTATTPNTMSINMTDNTTMTYDLSPTNTTETVSPTLTHDLSITRSYDDIRRRRQIRINMGSTQITSTPADPEVAAAEITPQANKEEFKIEEYQQRIVTLGDISAGDCPDSAYCNGKLRGSRYYCVKMRIFTEDDYYDTLCSTPFKTPRSAWITPGLILPFLLALIPFAAFASVIIWLVFRRKRYGNYRFLPSTVLTRASILSEPSLVLAYEDDPHLGSIERPSVIQLLQKIYEQYISQGESESFETAAETLRLNIDKAVERDGKLSEVTTGFTGFTSGDSGKNGVAEGTSCHGLNDLEIEHLEQNLQQAIMRVRRRVRIKRNIRHQHRLASPEEVSMGIMRTRKMFVQDEPKRQKKKVSLKSDVTRKSKDIQIIIGEALDDIRSDDVGEVRPSIDKHEADRLFVQAAPETSVAKERKKVHSEAIVDVKRLSPDPKKVKKKKLKVSAAHGDVEDTTPEKASAERSAARALNKANLSAEEEAKYEETVAASGSNGVPTKAAEGSATGKNKWKEVTKRKLKKEKVMKRHSKKISPSKPAWMSFRLMKMHTFVDDKTDISKARLPSYIPSPEAIKYWAGTNYYNGNDKHETEEKAKQQRQYLSPADNV